MRLSEAGWEVIAASRTPTSDMPGCREVALDRTDPAAVGRAIGSGVDLLLDCIAFDVADAAGLLAHTAGVGRFCVISSASVYRDAQGRTLDEAALNGFPDLPVGITEAHPTVPPGGETYSTRKVAVEQAMLAGAPGRATVLRPCAIYGPGSRHAREWWFVKRLLDRRAAIPLAYGGESRFHTTSVQSIAAAVLAAADGDAPAVMNVADPHAPTVAEIGRAIMTAMGRDAEMVPLPDRGFPPAAGTTPWSVPRPFVLAPSGAYCAAGGYADLVGLAVHDLVGRTRDRDWREVVPQLAAYPRPLFDYAAEDRALGLT